MIALPRMVVLCACIVPLAGCEEKREAPPPTRPALTLLVGPAAKPAPRRFTGTVEPRYQTLLGFQTAGRMTSREADVGDRVSNGQQLATLDPTIARLALGSAKADLANAKATLVNAMATDWRQQQLIKTGSTTAAQVDAAVAARNTAKAKVKEEEAAVKKAEEQLSYTVLKSGYEGVIESWKAEIGQVVDAGQTVVILAQPDIRDAVFDVPDDLIGQFQPKARFTVALLANNAVTVEAEVREVSPQSDAATRTRRIRLTLENASEAFRLGTTVTTMLIERKAPAIELPPDAILNRDGASSVWVVRPDGKLELKNVTLGRREDGVVTVEEGLQAGDHVLVAGVHSVFEGQIVKISEP